MGVLGALVIGCGVASLSLWYFSRRYLGEVSLPAGRPGYACFSVLDFWGHREVRLLPWIIYTCFLRAFLRAYAT